MRAQYCRPSGLLQAAQVQITTHCVLLHPAMRPRLQRLVWPVSTRTALVRCMVLQHQRLASRQPEPELAIHRCSCRRWSHREKVNLLHRLPAQGKVTSIIEEPLTNRCLTDTLCSPWPARGPAIPQQDPLSKPSPRSASNVSPTTPVFTRRDNVVP